MKKPKLISVTEFAKKTGFSRQWIHTLIKMGRLDAVRIGYAYYVNPDTKIKYLSIKKQGEKNERYITL